MNAIAPTIRATLTRDEVAGYAWHHLNMDGREHFGAPEQLGALAWKA